MVYYVLLRCCAVCISGLFTLHARASLTTDPSLAAKVRRKLPPHIHRLTTHAYELRVYWFEGAPYALQCIMLLNPLINP